MDFIRLIFTYKGDEVELTTVQPVDMSRTHEESSDVPGYHVVSRNAAGEKLHQVGAYGAFRDKVEAFGEDGTAMFVPVPKEGVFVVLVPDHPDIDHVTIKKLEPHKHVSLHERDLQRGMLAPALAETEVARFRIREKK